MVTIALLEKKGIKRSLYSCALQQMEHTQLVVATKNVDKLMAALTITPVDMVLYCWDTTIDKEITPLERLLKAQPKVKVLLLFTSFSFEIVFKLLQFKNCGYLEEQAKGNQLQNAIQQLMKKNYYFEPNLISQKRIIKHQETIKVQEESKLAFQFTNKQKEIITDMLAQKTTEEICIQHAIAESTLRKHYRDILRITQTKTMKAALIEIIANLSDKTKLWSIKCLVALCVLCSVPDIGDENDFEVNDERNYRLCG
ncbi:MAG: hypothetical protein WCJ62_03170 [Flavobacterium sp.]